MIYPDNSVQGALIRFNVACALLTGESCFFLDELLASQTDPNTLIAVYAAANAGKGIRQAPDMPSHIHFTADGQGVGGIPLQRALSLQYIPEVGYEVMAARWTYASLQQHPAHAAFLLACNPLVIWEDGLEGTRMYCGTATGLEQPLKDIGIQSLYDLAEEGLTALELPTDLAAHLLAGLCGPGKIRYMPAFDDDTWNEMCFGTVHA